MKLRLRFVGRGKGAEMAEAASILAKGGTPGKAQIPWTSNVTHVSELLIISRLVGTNLMSLVRWVLHLFKTRKAPMG